MRHLELSISGTVMTEESNITVISKSIRTISVVILLFSVISTQAALITRGSNVADGDLYPYTNTITAGTESFDVQMDGTLAANPSGHLYVSVFGDTVGIMKDANPNSSGNGDYRQINSDEEIHMTFSNIPAGKLVSISAVSGYGGSYFPVGMELYLSKNGQLIDTIYCDGSSSYLIYPPIQAADGDTVSLNPSGSIRLYDFTVNLVNDSLSNEPYIPDSTNTSTILNQTISESGHYYVRADWSGLTHKPDGVAARVYDPVIGAFRFMGEMGPDVGSLDLDLCVLNPGDSVELLGGLTGAAGEDPGLWTVNLTRYDSWSGSRYTPAAVPLAIASPLSGMDLHNDLWPRFSLFRADFEGQNSYTRFWNAVNETLGHAPKCYAEERLASAGNLAHMQRYAEENPDRQALLHWNGDCIKLAQTELPSGADQFKPYHFRYHAGTYLSDAVDDKSTTFTVYDATPFRLGVTDLAIVIPVDPVTGERDFKQCELVIITSISGNDLTVKRNAFGSVFGTSAKSYDAGAYLAPSIDPYNNVSPDETRFSYNMSVWCPRDSLGRNCGDISAEMLSSSFASGDELERFHGLMFDVLWKNQSSLSEDTNLDGAADGGLDPRGLDLYHLGTYGFAVKIRNAIPGRIITFDGNGSGWPRLHRLFNGMESEGFCHHNDAYNKDWGSALNWWQYTIKWNISEYPYIFCIPKVNDLPEGQDRRPFDLMNNAAGCILGITMRHRSATDPNGTRWVDDQHAYDEFRRGVDKVFQWLGAPAGEIIRPSLTSPDILAGAGLPASGWTPTNGSTIVTADPQRIRISGDPSSYSSLATMSISYSGITIPEGDLVIRFQAMGDAFTHFPNDVARYIKVTVDGRQPSEWNYDEQQAIFTTGDFTENAVFYRGAGAPGGSTVNLNLLIEGTNDVILRNFSIHNATDVLLREFENGVVLCNPSENPYTFDLGSYFPGKSFIRIQGQSYDDPITNDGSEVGDTVELASHSGLFLRRSLTPCEIARQSPTYPGDPVGDINADCMVNLLDLQLMAANWLTDTSLKEIIFY